MNKFLKGKKFKESCFSGKLEELLKKSDNPLVIFLKRLLELEERNKNLKSNLIKEVKLELSNINQMMCHQALGIEIMKVEKNLKITIKLWSQS